MDIDFFSLMEFPDDEQREEIRKNYFDTSLLWIDLETYQKNHQQQKQSKAPFITILLEENQDFSEKVRRFNNSIIYLTMAVFRFSNYYHLVTICDNRDRQTLLELWCRFEARCVCNEIFMYQEKIKNLLRNLFSLDMDETKRNDDFMKVIKKLSVSNPFLDKFCNVAKSFLINDTVKDIMQIRNDEIHNDSQLDNYTSILKTSKGSWALVNPRYVIPTSQLYDKIKLCLNCLLPVKEAVQNVVDHFI